MALKMLKKSVKPVTMYSKEEYEKMATSYAELSAQIKLLEEQKSMLADKLKAGAESDGVKDDKGSFYFDSTNYIVGKVASKSFSFNLDKAKEFLTKKKLWKSVTDEVTTTVLNETKIQNAVDTGKLTLADVEQFTDCKLTYKISVTKKEEMPDIDVSKFKAAKKR